MPRYMRLPQDDQPESSQPTEFPSVSVFYMDDFIRHTSREADYGVMWRADRSWPQWRVSYIQATGEVYAVELGGGGRVRILGVVHPDPEPQAARNAVYYRTLDRILLNYADPAVSGFRLSWVEERLRLALTVPCGTRTCPAGYAAGDPPLCETTRRCMHLDPDEDWHHATDCTAHDEETGR